MNDSSKNSSGISESGKSRRDFVKKAAYVAPAILTLKALPSFASSGSGVTQTPTNRGGSVFTPL